MKLIVGLGNYGEKYEHTRHNLGFDLIDAFADFLNVKITKNDFRSLYVKVGDYILLKPLTYMNLSGEAVKLVCDYFKIQVSDVLVISDDMALPPGKIRLRATGSAGGHNGLKNIIENLKSQDFKRLRIGIGEPSTKNTVDYVLSRPTKEELPLINSALLNALEVLKEYIKEDNFSKLMSKFNK